jgi:hypothetical protein
LIYTLVLLVAYFMFMKKNFYCDLSSAQPPTWRTRSPPYLWPPETGWPSYTPRHWVPILVPFYDMHGLVWLFFNPGHDTRSLNLIGNYMYHLLYQSVTLHFVFVAFIWFLLWTGIISFRIVFWDVLPCKMIVDRRFMDDGGSTHLWNVGRQSFYTAVHPRRQFWTSYSPPWELEISGIISLNSVNKLMVVMVKCGVLFGARTEFLSTIWTRFGFKSQVFLVFLCL